MQYTQLGRTGLKVSRLALGTMNFGWHTVGRSATRPSRGPPWCMTRVTEAFAN